MSLRFEITNLQNSTLPCDVPYFLSFRRRLYPELTTLLLSSRAKTHLFLRSAYPNLPLQHFEHSFLGYNSLTPAFSFLYSYLLLREFLLFTHSTVDCSHQLTAGCHPLHLISNYFQAEIVNMRHVVDFLYLPYYTSFKYVHNGKMEYREMQTFSHLDRRHTT